MNPKRWLRIALPMLIISAILACVFLRPPRPEPTTESSSATLDQDRAFDRLLDILREESAQRRTWRYPSEEQIRAMRARIADFAALDKAALAPPRQEAYDLLRCEFSLYEDSLKFFYYEEPFGPEGMHIALAAGLCRAGFGGEIDVREYLQSCRAIAGELDDMIAFEREKAARGLFITGAASEATAQWCEGFVDLNNKNPLITTFNERIEILQFPKEHETYYKEENKAVYYDFIVPAYERAAEALRELARTYGGKTKGLRELPEGREYADYRLRRLGLNHVGQTVALDRALLQREERLKTLEKQDLVLPMLKKTDAKKLFKQISEAASEDFPPLPRGVKVTILPMEDMEERASYGGYYVVPGPRNYKNNYIFYNPDISADKLFSVIAHEGIPGHLLATTQGLASDMPDYCKTLHYLGFVEGWAKYAEYYAYRYLEGDAAAIEYRRLNSEFGMLLSARLELGVHVDGWGPARIKEYIRGFFPEYGPQGEAFDGFWDNYISLRR